MIESESKRVHAACLVMVEPERMDGSGSQITSDVCPQTGRRGWIQISWIRIVSLRTPELGENASISLAMCALAAGEEMHAYCWPCTIVYDCRLG